MSSLPHDRYSGDSRPRFGDVLPELFPETPNVRAVEPPTDDSLVQCFVYEIDCDGEAIMVGEPTIKKVADLARVEFEEQGYGRGNYSFGMFPIVKGGAA